MKMFNPAVSKVWLILLAGIMWSAVGLMLSSLAYQWLVDLHSVWSFVIGFGSVLIGLLVYRFGFSHIALKNIQRLQAFLGNICIFAFMPWKSYLLVIGMMSLGLALRSSSIPHAYLAVIYITIGVALFLSSLMYYPHVWSEMRGTKVNSSKVEI